MAMGNHRRGVTVERCNAILERQENPRFLSDYIPSTFATREEAPSISRPAIIQSKKLGREMHVLGQPELHALLLALYHPAVFEIHEQKMLHRFPYMHPIAGFPGIDATSMPGVRGTVQVAERLGYLDRHPFVYVPGNPMEGTKIRRAFPYQGDLLLFLYDRDGAPYCVNWTVKEGVENFFRPNPWELNSDTPKAREKALVRYEIEVRYYLDADIRTQPVANQSIDWDVWANLCQIYPYTTKEITAVPGSVWEIKMAYQTALALGIAPMEVMESAVRRRWCNEYEARVIFFQMIWNRELRLDLFKPIVTDAPMAPEAVDVIEHYAAWFAR